MPMFRMPARSLKISPSAAVSTGMASCSPLASRVTRNAEVRNAGMGGSLQPEAGRRRQGQATR